MNCNWTQKPSKQAISDWKKVLSKEDVFKWHMCYTPWLNEDQIIQVLNYYDEILINGKDIQINNDENKLLLKTETLFEKLLLNN